MNLAEFICTIQLYFTECFASDEKVLDFKHRNNFLIYLLFYREKKFMKDARIFVLLKIPLTGHYYTLTVQSKPPLIIKKWCLLYQYVTASVASVMNVTHY